ncbi:MAG: Spy/CpxP family protein refolding chaperone [Bacteroidota bacterium]
MLRYAFSLLFASTLVITTGIAQGPGFNRVDQAINNLTETLELTPSQQDTIRRILEESAATMREAREATEGNREDRMQIMKSIQEKTDARVETVLTEDQTSKYQEYKKKRNERIMERRPERRMGPPGERGMRK